MSKDGKLFGKISIIDIGAVILVILLAAGVYIKFFGAQNQKKFSSRENYRCVVKVSNIRDCTVEALEKGGQVYDSITKEYIGDIKSVVKEPGENIITMADGSHKIVPVENRYNAYVTIDFSGRQSAEGYYTDTNKQISTGSTLNMNAKFAKCDGVIQSVSNEK